MLTTSVFWISKYQINYTKVRWKRSALITMNALFILELGANFYLHLGSLAIKASVSRQKTISRLASVQEIDRIFKLTESEQVWLD